MASQRRAGTPICTIRRTKQGAIRYGRKPLRIIVTAKTKMAIIKVVGGKRFLVGRGSLTGVTEFTQDWGRLVDVQGWDTSGEDGRTDLV